jgi:hypothetical protein
MESVLNILVRANPGALPRIARGLGLQRLQLRSIDLNDLILGDEHLIVDSFDSCHGLGTFNVAAG